MFGRTQLEATAIALVLVAPAILGAFSGVARAQSLKYEGIPMTDVDQGDLAVSDVQGNGMGDSGLVAVSVGQQAISQVQIEAQKTYPRLIDRVQEVDEDVVQGDYTNGYHSGESTMDRATRYHGAAVHGDDLTAADYSFESYNNDHGKYAKVARRLGVFDNNHTDPRHLIVHPFIEAAQVLDSFWSPAPERQSTYTDLVAGAEVVVNGRNNQGLINARLERRQGWGTTNSSSSVSGVANLSTSLFPNELRMDYGGYANTTAVTAFGATFANQPASAGAQSQILSGYFGPTLSTHLGEVGVTGHYRNGWSSLGQNGVGNAGVLVPGISLFDHSHTQDARLAFGVRPEQVLPIGISVIGGYATEDVGALSQKQVSTYARGEVIVPITDELAAVGGGGYEFVKVTSLDAVRDPVTGLPLQDKNGRFITNYSGPRLTALDVEETIWDAGLEWRPSRRTNVELHVGRRYGDVSGYGTVTYLPTPDTSINVVVYNNIGGFGSDLNHTLINVPGQIDGLRDGITGNISSCLSTVQLGSCLSGVVGSANSSFARVHGFTATYNIAFHDVKLGIGIGHDIHRYIAAANSVLNDINGKSDTYWWLDSYLGIRFNHKSQFETSLNLYKYHSGIIANTDLTSFRVVSVYQYFASKHVTMNAAVSINGGISSSAADTWSSSATMGMRYTF